jgi:uncharacterized protein YdeI (YjbR/CyaY-like superfamily)
MPWKARHVAFRNRAAFRAWLAKHHATASEIILRLRKARSPERCITYPEALDEALCFGWIDGVRRSLDADAYVQRFSPRKPRSIWSKVNIAHVARLTAEGRMMPPGIAAFEARDEARSGLYSFETRPTKLPPALEKRFRANPRAWTFFESQAPWYRRTTIYWVVSAKQEETRLRRLATLMACSEAESRIPALARGTASKKT